MKAGARIKELGIYQNRPGPSPSSQLKKRLLKDVDAITFTSASTVNNFLRHFTLAQIQTLFKRAKAVAIGPSTRQALVQNGVKKPLQAPQATLDQLVETLCRKISTK